MKALVLVAAACAGCFYFDASYSCLDRQDWCGASGTCEPCGFCSFRDDECDSKRRYGALAPKMYANLCVSEVAGKTVCDTPDEDLSSGGDFARRGDGGDLAAADDLAATDDLSAMDDMAMAGDLAAAGDLAGADFAMTTPQDLSRVDFPPVDGGGPCALPQLLIAVENTDTAQFSSSTILRYHIPPTGPPEACIPLSGRGQLAQHLRAVAFIPPDRIAAAADGWMNLIDPNTDSIVQSWSVENGLKPVDVAPIQVSGQTQAAVFYRRSTAALDTLILYKEGSPSPSPRTAVELSATTATGMTADPWDPTRLWMTASPTEILAIDPIAPSGSTYLDESGLSGTYSIVAFRDGNNARLLWSALNTFDAYYSGNHPMGNMPQMGGPWFCGGCDTMHAVPDPSQPTMQAFVLCDAGGGEGRAMVRTTGVIMNPGPTAVCQAFFSGSALGLKERINRLAIAMP